MEMIINECNILKESNSVLEQKKDKLETEIQDVRVDAEKSELKLKESFREKERETILGHEQEI
jgi:hypothetical protein